MSAAYDHDVLVVGLGPTGAALSALLARAGLRVLAIDRDTAVYPLPRAVHFDHEIMRLFQQLGVADAVLEHARPVPTYEFRSAAGELLLQLPPAAHTPSDWGSGYMFHQPSFETAIRAVLDAAPTVTVQLGCRLVSFDQDADGAAAHLSGPDGEQAVRVRYLVGCDGASSRVREAIGGGLFDYGFDEPWLVVDARLTPGSRLPEVNLQVCDPARPTTCVQGGLGRHRWEFMILPGETPESLLDDTVIRGLIAPWNCGPVEIERKAVYRFHGLVANRWRSGRALIAGDAAHQTPPFAGQGMCAGLRDAANLAWKLAAVIGGDAAETLLDSYQAEREPHARSAIELAIGMGRLVCTLDPEAAAMRDAGMLAARAAGAPALPPMQPAPFAAGCVLAGSPAAGAMFPQPGVDDGHRRLRLDDVLGDGAWLFTTTPTKATAPGVRILPLEAEDLILFRYQLRTWLDRTGAPAVLVRPDRYVFGAGEPDMLLRRWREALEAPEMAEA